MKSTTTLLVTGLVWLGSYAVQAQEFKIAKTSGTLEIKEVNNLTVEGSTGNEVIFKAKKDVDPDRDDRSKGLRAISALGYEDNTGIGLSAITKGDVVEVRQLKKTDGPEITISLPKGVAIYYEHTSPYGSDVVFRNVEGKIEVSTVHNQVHLENVTGPIDVKSVHGEVDASFPITMKNAIHISSVHGLVDVTLPVGIKATVSANTHFGEIMVDPDFKIEVQRSGTGLVKYNGGVTGTINGGGLEIDLSSTHSSIYIRKK